MQRLTYKYDGVPRFHIFKVLDIKRMHVLEDLCQKQKIIKNICAGIQA